MREVYPFTDVDNGGPVKPERLEEIREQAEYASVTCDAEELLWMLGRIDRFEVENSELRTSLEQAHKRIGDLVSENAELRVDLDAQRMYGEQLQMSIDSCSGGHADIDEAASRALGLGEEATDA